MKNWKTNLTGLIMLIIAAYSVIINKASWTDVIVIFPVLTALGFFAAKDHNTPK